jgi:hypothetical protein
MALLAFLPCSLASLHEASALDRLKNGFSDECLLKGQWQKTYKAMPFVAALTVVPQHHGRVRQPQCVGDR